MQCPRCLHENPAGGKFCGECGARLEYRCPACHTSNPPANKFCQECGEPLTARQPAAKPVAPQAYTPPHLAEKILTSRGVLEGERKQVTVLFADIKGSMELLADRDPEEARRLVDPALGQMMDAVHRYEGTVNQVLGDGIMALFGAPLAHEDHAVRACYAALAMQSAARRYSEEVRRSHGVELLFRVGLNSGEVVVRTISNDLHMDYSAIGQTTHLAARMEQLATPDSIRLTAYTLRLAEGFIQVKPLGPVPVKGLRDKVEVFELVGAVALRTRMQAVAARGLTRFVGRQAELDALGRALKRAGAGHGQVGALVGEPGVGKSRLIWEFTHSHRTQGWLLLESGSVSYGKAAAYRPLIDLLKGYFGIEERDDGRRIREKITGKLLTLDKTLEPTLPAFLTLLDVPVEDPEWQSLHPSQRRQRTLEACKRLLLRESHVQPLVLVFEDLHWVDSETRAFLESLIESLPAARILMLVNYRPEYQHGWGSKTYYHHLRVDPLPAESAEELLEGLLGAAPELQPLRRILVERTEGNPFFLEESVRSLVEDNILVGERGRYRLATPLTDIPIPTTVQAVLAARVDRLPPEEKRLLQTAAVIGKDVPFTLLQAIADLPDDALRSGLADLQAAEFLYETSLFPDLEYTFKHALTHEVAYAGILQERRRVIHARIVEAIEALHRDRLAEHIERLGHHAMRGEVWEKAIAYLRQVGAKAVARSANAQAAACYEQALAALERLPGTRETLERAVDIRLESRSALHPLGELEQVFTSLQKAQALAEALRDERRLGRVLSFLVQSFRLMGDYHRAIEAGQRAVAIGQAYGDLPIQVTANVHLGQAHFQLGAYGRAMELQRRNIDLLTGDLARERHGLAGLPIIYSRGYLGWSLVELGRCAEAVSVWEEGARITEAVKHPYSQAFAQYCGGYLYLTKGEIEPAISRLEHGLALCRAMNIRQELPFCAAFLGWAYALAGRLAEGIALIQEAIEAATSMKLVASRSRLVGLLGEAQLDAGRLDEAGELARQALELARAQGERGWEAWALRLAGKLDSHREPPDAGRAADAYRRARALADELGMRRLAAHCDLGLGQLYLRTRDAARARERLTAAASQFREMGMPFWAHRAEAELRTARARARPPSRA